MDNFLKLFYEEQKVKRETEESLNELKEKIVKKQEEISKQVDEFNQIGNEKAFESIGLHILKTYKELRNKVMMSILKKQILWIALFIAVLIGFFKTSFALGYPLFVPVGLTLIVVIAVILTSIMDYFQNDEIKEARNYKKNYTIEDLTRRVRSKELSLENLKSRIDKMEKEKESLLEEKEQVETKLNEINENMNMILSEKSRAIDAIMMRAEQEVLLNTYYDESVNKGRILVRN